jgi:hypothetical protein
MTFNPYSIPGFAAALLFWLLAAYALTRSPVSVISLAAVATEVATAAYFLGQAMQANATTAEEWLPWARNLFWGATVAPTAWFWLALLLLRDQPTERARGLLRRAGYPLGALFALASVALTAAIFLGDLLFGWSAPAAVPPERAAYFRFAAPAGPLYPWFVGHLVATTLGAAAILGSAWHLAAEQERRHLFRWLFISAVLLVPAASAFSVATWLGLSLWPPWVTDLAVAGAVAFMTSNVAAYGLFLRGQVIRTDLLYFSTTLGLLCLAYALAFALIGPPVTFAQLELLAAILLLTVLSHGLARLGRGVFDRLFFRGDVRRLRSSLSTVVENAALTRDQHLDRLVEGAQSELADISAEHLARLTQEALRRLNGPAGLADCGLIERLPRTLAAVRARRGDGSAEATPLGQAQALREAVVEAIERLKPPDRETGLGAPAALQYHILREAYVQGLPNKQVMTRHSISESTFHRNRREAVAILARELARQEDLLGRSRSPRAGAASLRR